jgi:hypothetical protein
MRKAILGIGVVLILLGGLWTLQGIGVIGGSVMSGQSFWAIVGSLMLIAGAVACLLGLRGGTRRPEP